MVSSSLFPSLRSPSGTRSRSQSPAPQPIETRPRAPVQSDSAGTNTGMSACEMFPMWNALAAARRERCSARRKNKSKENVGKRAAQAMSVTEEQGGDDTGTDSTSEDGLEEEEAQLPAETQRPASLDSQATLAPPISSTARPALVRQTTKSSLMDQQAQWVQKDLGETEEMHEAAARQFAELSLEPPIQEVDAAPSQPEPANQDSSSTAIPNTGATDPSKGDELHLTDEQKLQAIQEEFGEIASTVTGPDGKVEEERMVANVPSLMFKGVMMVGNVHLTTHRLLFHAPLPPDEAFVRKYTSTGEPGEIPAFDQPVKSTDLLHSGPVTWHRSGPLVSAQRVWLELSAEMLSTYPSADDVGRTRPLKSILLSSVRRLEPPNHDRLSDFVIHYDGPSHPLAAHFTVDTEQSAAAWRRDLEAAMYRLTRKRWRQILLQNRQLGVKAGLLPSTSSHDGAASNHVESGAEWDDNQWSMMRYCVPLNQVDLVATDGYHGLGQIVSLEVSVNHRKALFEAERVGKGDYYCALETAEEQEQHADIKGKGAAESSGSHASHGILHLLGAGYGTGGGQDAHASNSAHQGGEGNEGKRRLSFPKLARRFSGNKDRKNTGSGSTTPSRLGPNAVSHSHEGAHTPLQQSSTPVSPTAGSTVSAPAPPMQDLARHIKSLQQRNRQASRDASEAHARELQGELESASGKDVRPVASPDRMRWQEGSAIASAPGSPLTSPPLSPQTGSAASGSANVVPDIAGGIATTSSDTSDPVLASAPAGPAVDTGASTQRPATPTPGQPKYAFNLVLLRDWEYFIDPLRASIEHAHAFRPVAGTTQAQVSLNIAGMDMLVTDEELEALRAARALQKEQEGERKKHRKPLHLHTRDGPAQGDHVTGSESNSHDTGASDSDDYIGDAIDNEDDLDMDPAHHQHKNLGVKGTVKHVGHAASAAAKRVRKAEKTHMMAREFGLKEEEGIWIKRSYVIHAGMPMRGHIIVTPRFFCFWRRMLMSHDIKYRFKTSDIKGINAIPAPAHPHPFGLALHLHAQHDVQFVFWHRDARDEVLRRVQEVLDSHRAANGDEADGSGQASRQPPSAPVSPGLATGQADIAENGSPFSPVSTPGLSSIQNSTAPPTSPGQLSTHSHTYSSSSNAFAPAQATPGHAADILAPTRDLLFTKRTLPDAVLPILPFIANKPWVSRTSSLSPRTFACLTIGSRGDVQPYIALGVRLLKDGHKVVIITHAEFKEWVEGYGIEHRQAGGDPTVLMKFSSDHSMLSPGFFKEALGTMRQWLDDLLVDAWKACHDVDVLIESPSAMAGVHIAEARKIPYFRAFTMPWNRTSAYPQAFMVPAFDMGPSFNYSTYTLYDNVIWTATSGQINKWRKKHLGLPATSNAQLSTAQIPYLYNFSEAVVPKPLDWSDAVNITGYWTLENSDNEWSPPKELEEFMRKAKEDGKALVYIGFGSIVVSKPNQVTRSIIEAVEKADVRAIIAKGWSSRGGDPSEEGQDIEFPASCYSLEKVPHGWLFPKIDAAMHHGGAGTTGASLGAGLPTIIKPFFGDQYFWALRVTKLGVGLKATSFRASDMASALKKVTTDSVMREKAARVGRAIRRENGVDNALEAIHFNIVRAAADRGSLRFNK